jgi:hypothetical protein
MAGLISLFALDIDISQMQDWALMCEANYDERCNDFENEHETNVSPPLTLIDVQTLFLDIPKPRPRYAALN